MQEMLEICCGLDVHKDSVVACLFKRRNAVIPESAETTEDKEIRTYNTFLNDLEEIKKWLETENYHNVAMESTGVCWFLVYDVLESAFEGNIELLVTNARHMKNVPGKKTDIKDSEWIATLLRAGLLRVSFIPPSDIRESRQLTGRNLLRGLVSKGKLTPINVEN